MCIKRREGAKEELGDERPWLIGELRSAALGQDERGPDSL
jgi:hypothetical protein